MFKLQKLNSDNTKKDRKIYVACVLLVAIGLILATRKQFNQSNSQLKEHHKNKQHFFLNIGAQIPESYSRKFWSVNKATKQTNAGDEKNSQLVNSDVNNNSPYKSTQNDDQALYDVMSEALTRLEQMSRSITRLQQKIKLSNSRDCHLTDSSHEKFSPEEQLEKMTAIKIHNNAWIDCLEKGICKLNKLMP